MEDFGEGDLDVVRLDGRIAELDERLSNEIDNIGDDVIGVEANVTELQTEVEGAVRELDTQIQTNADNVALKVSISDIVNDLTSTDTDKPLSANQGKVLNETTAKLTASNVFTQPQIVPNAENDDEAVNLGQLNTHIRSNYYDIEKVDIIMEDLDTHIRSNYYDKDYIDDLEENITQHVTSNYYDINKIDNKLKSLVVDGGNV